MNSRDIHQPLLIILRGLKYEREKPFSPLAVPHRKYTSEDAKVRLYIREVRATVQHTYLGGVDGRSSRTMA
jgi:hypothetical protein